MPQVDSERLEALMRLIYSQSPEEFSRLADKIRQEENGRGSDTARSRREKNAS